MEQLSNQQDYRLWLTELKANIRKSQIKAAIAVNSELIRLYWNLGEQIVEKQQASQWGSGFIEQLSKDLQVEFPDIKGLSASNLRRCKQFYLFYCQVNPICAQVVRELEASFLFEIPWGHHVLLLGRIKFLKEALFYIHKTVENGWSRAILEYHIEKGLFHQQGKSINNFTKTLLPPQSELANELVRDEYDRPTIGILLCKGKDDYEVEFSLRDINKPIGVSSYTYNELPEDIRQALPDIQELKNQLNNFEHNNQQDIQ